MTSWQAAGLILGFAGAVLIFTPWQTTSGLTSAGALECLAASVSYAISYIYMDRFLARRDLSAIVLSACQLTAAAVMLALALAVTGAPAPHVTAESVAAIVVLGIVGTGFAYVLNYQIITSEGATAASTVTYLLPVVAIVLGVLVLGESVTVTVLAGIALVLAGVALTRRHPKTSRRQAPDRVALTGNPAASTVLGTSPPRTVPVQSRVIRVSSRRQRGGENGEDGECGTSPPGSAWRAREAGERLLDAGPSGLCR